MGCCARDCRAAALHIAIAEGARVSNVALTAGATSAFCFSGGGVAGTLLDRLAVPVADIGGRAVKGCAAGLSFAVARLE